MTSVIPPDDKRHFLDGQPEEILLAVNIWHLLRR